MVNKYRFMVGDLVELVKPFRCSGDDLETDREINNELLEVYGNKNPTGQVERLGDESGPSAWIQVRFDKDVDSGSLLYVDEDVLEYQLSPVTPDEERAAINSILGHV